jgi:hypothetical protein
MEYVGQIKWTCKGYRRDCQVDGAHFRVGRRPGGGWMMTYTLTGMVTIGVGILLSKVMLLFLFLLGFLTDEI